MDASKIGIYGLGVMGRNLALNLEESGFSVSVFNRKAPGEETVVQDFIEADGQGKNFVASKSLKSFLHSLETPRKILLIVKSGKPVDQVLASLLKHLKKGDIIIDAGNSHYKDTMRRIGELDSFGIHFIGMGISGGEQGARFGPSLMPGGKQEAWPEIQPIFQKISAAAFDGSPCCTWIGDSGAGHFVKMVHNGIEYAEMQLLAEVYHILKKSLKMDGESIGELFKEWNQTSLNSYLVEITSEILQMKDDDGQPLLEKILDSAGQKGTGKWTAIDALDNNIPLPGISQAVFSRFISNFVDLRNRFSKHSVSLNDSPVHSSELIENLQKALLASKMSAYAEGFFLISSISNTYKWNLDLASIARIWQGGCIVRSVFLKEIQEIYRQNPTLKHLFLANDFAAQMNDLQKGWRASINHAVNSEIPVPCMIGYLTFFDALRSKSLPANLIQAQRDYFGAHTYERIDKPRGQFFHTDWGNQ